MCDLLCFYQIRFHQIIGASLRGNILMEIHPQQVLKKAESGGMLWNVAGCLIPLFRLFQEVAECLFSL